MAALNAVEWTQLSKWENGLQKLANVADLGKTLISKLQWHVLVVLARDNWNSLICETPIKRNALATLAWRF